MNKNYARLVSEVFHKINNYHNDLKKKKKKV